MVKKLASSPAPKKPGRPKIHDKTSDRTKVYREKKKRDYSRKEIYLDSEASWRLDALAKAWNLTKSLAAQRLIMEAAESYCDILLPVTKHLGISSPETDPLGFLLSETKPSDIMSPVTEHARFTEAPPETKPKPIKRTPVT